MVFGKMVSTPYYRGRNREYKVMAMLREEGWVCSRSAMSHGPVDIFAGKDGETILIQVKSGKARISKQEKEKLAKWAKAFGSNAEIWYFKNRNGVIKEKLN
jgi:Holliday junction resolvase